MASDAGWYRIVVLEVYEARGTRYSSWLDHESDRDGIYGHQTVLLRDSRDQAKVHEPLWYLTWPYTYIHSIDLLTNWNLLIASRQL